MPQLFKALSSIIVWVLFIFGWIGVLAAIGGYTGIITGLFQIPNVGGMALGAADYLGWDFDTHDLDSGLKNLLRNIKQRAKGGDNAKVDKVNQSDRE